jgi:hypothetical protein
MSYEKALLPNCRDTLAPPEEEAAEGAGIPTR